VFSIDEESKSAIKITSLAYSSTKSILIGGCNVSLIETIGWEFDIVE
jgi:hypothetical protein